MKRILAPILLVVLLFPSLALGGEVTFDDLVITNDLYYKKFTDVPFTGEVMGRGNIKDGKKDGPWVSYNKDGRVSARETYKDGKLNGPRVEYEYYSNGQLRYKDTYKNGEIDGAWVWYHNNGQLQYKGTYKDGWYDGSWVW